MDGKQRKDSFLRDARVEPARYLACSLLPLPLFCRHDIAFLEPYHVAGRKSADVDDDHGDNYSDAFSILVWRTCIKTLTPSSNHTLVAVDHEHG
jgi:hypothetical protein